MLGKTAVLKLTGTIFNIIFLIIILNDAKSYD